MVIAIYRKINIVKCTATAVRLRGQASHRMHGMIAFELQRRDTGVTPRVAFPLVPVVITSAVLPVSGDATTTDM
jgi:hypothetical protein